MEDSKKKYVVVSSSEILIQGRYITENYKEAVGMAYLIANEIFDSSVTDEFTPIISNLKELEGDTGCLISIRESPTEKSLVYILEVEEDV